MTPASMNSMLERQFKKWKREGVWLLLIFHPQYLVFVTYFCFLWARIWKASHFYPFNTVVTVLSQPLSHQISLISRHLLCNNICCVLLFLILQTWLSGVRPGVLGFLKLLIKKNSQILACILSIIKSKIYTVNSVKFLKIN